MHIANDKPGPLDGIRVLDLTKTIAGPYCTMLLGDMGADVIKVEVPGKGDDFRHASPFVNGVSHYFLFANRNKRSITLDLKQESAKQILRKLAEKSDVIVENFRPGVVKKLGADYETISALNPKVVYCSISGFGQTGPYRDRAAYDLVMQGMYGFISFLDDCNGKPPTPFAIPIADISAALFAAYGICSALVGRERTGIGQYIDTSLMEASISILSWMAMCYFAFGKEFKFSEKSKLLVPYGIFFASDGSFVLEAANDATFQRLCGAIGRPELLNDPKFRTAPSRAKNHDELVSILQAIFSTNVTSVWLDKLEKVAVPAGPIRGLKEVFSDPQVLHRQMMVEMNTATWGDFKLLGMPIKLSKTPSKIARPPPALGEHTSEILKEIGYDDQAISRFRIEGAV